MLLPPFPAGNLVQEEWRRQPAAGLGVDLPHADGGDPAWSATALRGTFTSFRGPRTSATAKLQALR